MAPKAPKELTPDPAKVRRRRRRRPPRYRRTTFFCPPRLADQRQRPRPVFGALPSAPRRRLTFLFKSPSQGPAEFIIDTEPGRGGVLASTPAYFKIKTADGKDWLALKTHTRRANGTFQIENYVREDEKNKSQGKVLVTMGETKVTEVKFGKELGNGDDFYLRGPMTKNQSKDFPKRDDTTEDADGNKIPTEDNVKWRSTDKYTCYDWYGYVNNDKDKRPGNGQWYRMKYQVKSEAPFTMQDGAVYTLKCEETGWLRQIWVIQKPPTLTQSGNAAYTERQMDTVEQTFTLVDAHGKTMHT